MATLEQVERALRAADAAGNTEDAARLAQAYAAMRGQDTVDEPPPLEIDIVGGTPVSASEFERSVPADGLGAGLKRLGWSLADTVLPESALSVLGETLGARESLADYQAQQALPSPTPVPSRPELGVMEHYNPTTGTIDYPEAGASSLGTIGRGVLGGAASGVGFLADVLNAPNVAFQNVVVNPLRGAAPLSYSGNTDNLQQGLVELGALPQSVTDLPENRRAAYYGGEAIGASLPIMGAMNVANRVRQGAQVARIQEGTARGMRADPQTVFQPRQFPGFGVQAGSAVGAGVGAAAGETIAPGDPVVRMGSEIIGSIFHPTHLASRAIEAAGGVRAAAGRLVSDGRFDPKALQSGAVRRAVVDNIQRAGEDPEQVLAALRANRRGDLSQFTTDVMSGSDGLRNMTNYLRRQSPDFLKRIDEKNRTAWEATLAAADRMATNGSPEALQSAASLYRRAFEDVFSAQVAGAEDKARRAASRLGQDGPAQMRAAGEAMAEVANDAWRGAKEFESAAWKAVPRDTPIIPEATRRAIGGETSRVVDVHSIMPHTVRRFAREVLPEGNATSGEMLEFYFELRGASADMRAAGNMGDARRVGQVANSVLEDLAGVPNAQAARLSSREIHEVFDRTFAGGLLQSGAYGTSRVDPGTAAARAVAGGAGGTQRLERADELRAAAAYDPNRAPELRDLPGVPAQEATSAAAGARAGSMQESLEQANLARLQGAVEPESGRVATGTLSRRLAEGESLGTPASQYMGEQALSAEQAAQRTASRASGRMARLDSPQESTLARVLNREGQTSTTDIVTATLRRADAAMEYERLARVAGNRRITPELRAAARDDLAAGTVGAALKEGGTNGPLGVDMIRARRALIESPGQGRPAPIELMERTGVVDATHARRLRQFFSQSAEAQRMLANTSADIDVASPSAWFDALARIGGAKLGGQAAQKVFGGTDIQTPGIMARLFQRALRAMPQYNPQQAMMEVIMDPNALETTLEAALRQKGDRLSLSQASRLRKTTAGMVQAGLIPKEAYDEIVVEIDAAESD